MVCQASEAANEIFVLFCIHFFCCHIEIHFAIRARNKKNENLHAASGKSVLRTIRCRAWICDT